jgi:biopolymer transport protein TolR
MAVLVRRTPGRRRMLADINVVPYIDVMLVLVVILMVSAPFVNPSLVQLPTLGKAARAPDTPIEIIVKADGQLLFQNRAAGAADAVSFRLEDLPERLSGPLTAHPDTPVVISGDKGVRYEAVTQVMDALYKLNVQHVGLAVKPAN